MHRHGQECERAHNVALIARAGGTFHLSDDAAASILAHCVACINSVHCQ